MLVSVDSDLIQLRRQLTDRSDLLAKEGTPDSLFKLRAINQSLQNIEPGTGSISDELSAQSLATSNRSLAKGLVDSLRKHPEQIAGVAETLHHALRIARDEILVPELSRQDRSDLISIIKNHYKVDLSGIFHQERTNPLIMSFTVPAGTTISTMCADLIIGCKALQRPQHALEIGSQNWIERRGQVPLNEERDVRIDVGLRMPRAANLSLGEQMERVSEIGMRLPDRGIATIMHSLAYLTAGRSIFESYTARLSDGAGVTFSERGLIYEVGQKIDRFNQVFPVRLSLV